MLAPLADEPTTEEQLGVAKTAPVTASAATKHGLARPLASTAAAPDEPAVTRTSELLPASATSRRPSRSKARPCGLLRPLSTGEAVAEA